MVRGRLGRIGTASALTAALAAVISASGLAPAGTAAAATRETAGGTPSVPGIVHAVAEAAQDAAAGYWTPARMASATPVTSARPSGSGAPPGTPNPVYSNGVRTVGALFFTTGTKTHFCTASVVDSATLNIVLTAAHCVYGSGYATRIAYVPGWHRGVSPYGVWPVQSITVASGWQQSHSDSLDFAFLKVAPPSGQPLPVQLVTGGLVLGIDQGYAHPVEVVGYNDTDSRPVKCATKSFEFKPGQMEFYCNGFWDGTSGGPWITNFDASTGTGMAIGDIGGYEQGGDYPWASYSDYYGEPTLQLFHQAQASQV